MYEGDEGRRGRRGKKEHDGDSDIDGYADEETGCDKIGTKESTDERGGKAEDETAQQDLRRW